MNEQTQKYEQECRDNFNCVGVFGGFYLLRVIGYREDDEDCYFIGKNSHDEIVFYSMVGGFDALDFNKASYTYNIWDNHCPPEKEFRLEIEITQ